MFFNKIKSYVYQTEILEIDIKQQLSYYKKNYIFNFIKILLIKLFRSFYRTIQRNIIKPSIRFRIINYERYLIRLLTGFNKKNINMRNNTLILKKNSFLKLDNLFNSEELNEIKLYLNSRKNMEEIFENNLNKKLDMKYYKTEDLINNPLILKAACDPKILELLSNYFGCKFKLDWIWSWWSFTNKDEVPMGPQKFHRDYESFNFLKLFVYLTDVIGDDGGHQIVKGSHYKNLSYKIQRYSDEEIEKNYSNEEIATIDGNKGQTFLANTFAIHRGLKPKNNDRLVLVYLFSVIPSRRSPKIPPINFSEIKTHRDKFFNNKYIFSNFINFRK